MLMTYYSLAQLGPDGLKLFVFFFGVSYDYMLRAHAKPTRSTGGLTGALLMLICPGKLP